jgi:hypothetical protein
MGKHHFHEGQHHATSTTGRLTKRDERFGAALPSGGRALRDLFCGRR